MADNSMYYNHLDQILDVRKNTQNPSDLSYANYKFVGYFKRVTA